MQIAAAIASDQVVLWLGCRRLKAVNVPVGLLLLLL